MDKKDEDEDEDEDEAGNEGIEGFVANEDYEVDDGDEDALQRTKSARNSSLETPSAQAKSTTFHNAP